MSDLPTREDSEWTCRLVARNDPLTAAEANQASAIIKAYVQCGTGSGHGEPLLTRAEAAADPEVRALVMDTVQVSRGMEVGHQQPVCGKCALPRAYHKNWEWCKGGDPVTKVPDDE